MLSEFPSRPPRPLPFRCAVFLATVSVCAVASAQMAPPSSPTDRAHLDEVLRSLSRGRSVVQVAVSPDGKRLAWVQDRHDGSDIFVAPAEDLSHPEHVSADVQPNQHCRENQILWQ